jgi:2-dehydro-3-deoxyphosphogluconate aldolase/(4S)-4-hydroxy-2-oxoglutarate aldolase
MIDKLDVSLLREQRCVAIIRARTTDHFATTAMTLADSGIGILEFPLTTPGVLAALPPIVAELRSRAHVGVGSVTTVDLAVAAHRAGAGFLVSPNFDPAVIAYANEVGLPILAGAFTPSEVFAAWRAGATAVKLFPASVGGPRYVRELIAGPYPDIPLIPTGGVEIADIPEYLAAGAIAFGLGSSLLGAAADGGSPVDLRERVASLQAAVAR